MTARFRIAPLALAALLAALAPARAEAESYALATAAAGGTQNLVGVALATLVKVTLQPGSGIEMAALATQGAAENVRLLREGAAQFAILQGIDAAGAASGPPDDLRAVAALWPDVAHVLIASDRSSAGTLSDLAGLEGEAVAIGASGSDANAAAAEILRGVGLDAASFAATEDDGEGAAAALLEGRVEGAVLSAGLPSPAVADLLAASGGSVRLLGVTPEERARIDAGRGAWAALVIPGGTYPGQAAAVTALALPNLLAARADVPEEDVYLVTKAIFENLPFLQAIHPAALGISLDRALDGVPMPLHPGAIRYFEEAGLRVPPRLRPAE